MGNFYSSSSKSKKESYRQRLLSFTSTSSMDASSSKQKHVNEELEPSIVMILGKSGVGKTTIKNVLRETTRDQDLFHLTKNRKLRSKTKVITPVISELKNENNNEDDDDPVDILGVPFRFVEKNSSFAEENAMVIVYTVDCSRYDDEKEMLSALEEFYLLIHQYPKKTFVVLLNKSDLMKQKLKKNGIESFTKVYTDYPITATKSTFEKEFEKMKDHIISQFFALHREMSMKKTTKKLPLVYALFANHSDIFSYDPVIHVCTYVQMVTVLSGNGFI